MFTRGRSWITAIALMYGLMSWSVARAQDEDAKDKTSVKERRAFTVRVAAGKHWLGIHPTPIDDALKAQLNLKDRLMVQHVFPNSPAAEAGLQAHDVLLKFADQDVHKVEDLIKAVEENGEKEAKLVVLRGGKETTLTIKPGDRPKDEELHGGVPQLDAQSLLKRFNFHGQLNDDNTIVWRALGPGIWSHVFNEKPFPNGLSLTVSKENDQPARIVAKKDGKTYETTEDRLDVLPEDIRGYVQRLVSGPGAVTFSIGPDGKVPHGLDPEKAKKIQKAAEAAKKQIEEKLSKAESEAANAIRRIEIRKLDSNPLDDLRKEIESLKKEVEQLKAKSGDDAKSEDAAESVKQKNEASNN